MVTLINHFVKFNILSLTTNSSVKLLTLLLLLFIITTFNIINTYIFLNIYI